MRDNHRREIEELRRAGNIGHANRYERWAIEQGKKVMKKEDDRIKVLLGAALLYLWQQGRVVDLKDADAGLSMLDSFLVRPADRRAVLGEDGKGSPAFKRCISTP